MLFVSLMILFALALLACLFYNSVVVFSVHLKTIGYEEATMAFQGFLMPGLINVCD